MKNCPKCNQELTQNDKILDWWECPCGFNTADYNLEMVVPRVNNTEEAPTGNYLIHLKEQWETAVQEVLFERGYVFKWETDMHEQGVFQVKFKGKEPDDSEMDEIMRLAAGRSNQKLKEP